MIVTYHVTRKRIYPEVLFNTGHDIDRWFVATTAEIKSAQKSMAPPHRSAGRWRGRKGTGNLNRAIYGRTKRRGGLVIDSVTGVDLAKAPYAVHVLGGTAAQGRRYIYTSNGWRFKPVIDQIARRVRKGGQIDQDLLEMSAYMRLPLSNVGGSRVFHLRVHGQRANNFLIDGYNIVAARHGALKPIANKYAF